MRKEKAVTIADGGYVWERHLQSFDTEELSQTGSLQRSNDLSIVCRVAFMNRNAGERHSVGDTTVCPSKVYSTRRED